VRIPLCEGLAREGLTVGVAVDLCKLHLMHEPLARFERTVGGLPWRAADSCRTLGIFAVAEAGETLACGWRLGSIRERDAGWSWIGRPGLGGPRLAGGRRRWLGSAARLQGLPFDSPPGRPLGALFGPPIA
jgi:hypothetical protein